MLQDEVLIQKIQNGEQDAFLYMIDTYSKLLWVVVGGILGTIGTPQDIEECISDVYVHVWQNPKAFNANRGSFKTFLAIVAKSKALDVYRKLSKSKVIEINEAISSSDDDLLGYVLAQEMHGELYSAIESLTEPNKEIVIRRFFFEEKPKAIADKTSLPVKEVENRLYQSKIKLRKILEGDNNLCTSKI
ncbi:MAG: sigma-70 family RNA polymerase sigma factor [Defluviitaleaceae bacterium]|nr:sigma-70 family RNA polymerase sigma factor [Defluviitaleaceae bacterium]MCL2262607.1 sigma-70 family RNA polymerase sigma factor [Defluviitaleaceae bacterium]